MAVTAERLYTYSDYVKFTFDEMVEIIRGRIYKMSPAPSTDHQRVSMQLSIMLGYHLKKQSCQVFAAPFDVVLPQRQGDYDGADVVVQPDLCVVSDTDKIKPQGCFGAPDWIIEILSPHTAKKDLQDKFEVYEEAGVREYWMVDPLHRSVEVFFLVDQSYRRLGAYVASDKLVPTTLPGLVINLSEVFKGVGH